jgi:hypothetical protein
MNPEPSPPNRSSYHRDYWLHRCEGFRVDSPRGRLGIVEELRFGTNAERPDSLAIRTGWLRRRLIVVPIERVGEILPRERRIVLLD